MSRSKQKRPLPSTEADRAVLETFRLYHAWLGYLLRRLGETEIRVPVAELTRALGQTSCAARREGNEYVITLIPQEGEVPHGRTEETQRD